MSTREVPNRWLTTVAVTVGTLMGAIDSSIINVALPQMQASYGVTITEITWISTAYLMALVLIMPLTAWLGTVFGRKTVYQACLVIFTAASVLAGLATSLPMLIVARVLQGLGAGALQPTEQAILRETFPAEEQGLAMGLYGLAVMIGPAVGPTLGGWITDNYGWRWIFFINLPIGIIGSLMVASFVTEPAYIKQMRTRIDGVGIALMSVGLSCLLLVLEEGAQWDWFASPLVWGFGLVAVSCLVLFVAWELWGTDQPAVDLRLLKNRGFAAGTTIGGLLGMALFGCMFLLPLFLENLLGYTSMDSGIALMPRALVMLVMMPISGFLYNKLGPHLLIGTGFVVTGYSMYQMSHFTLSSGPAEILWPQVISGLGFALMFVALSTTALATVPREKMTAAAGLYNLIRQLGGSFGTAIFATMLDRQIHTGQARLAEHATAFSPAFSHAMSRMTAGMMQHGMSMGMAQHQALTALQGLIGGQAAVLAFQHIFEVVAVLMVLPMLVLPLLQRPAAVKPSLAHAE